MAVGLGAKSRIDHGEGEFGRQKKKKGKKKKEKKRSYIALLDLGHNLTRSRDQLAAQGRRCYT